MRGVVSGRADREATLLGGGVNPRPRRFHRFGAAIEYAHGEARFAQPRDHVRGTGEPAQPLGRTD